MRRARPLLGTIVEIEVDGAGPAIAERAIAAAFDAIALVQRLMSFHDCDSDLGRINREAFRTPVRVHPLTARVLRRDRKSTRLNSSHVAISYAVFCLKKKKK